MQKKGAAFILVTALFLCVGAVPDSSPNISQAQIPAARDPRDSNLLRVVNWDELDSRLVWTYPNRLSLDAKGNVAFIFFGGTGAKRGEKGIEMSMSGPMAILKRRNAMSYAVENPLYRDSHMEFESVEAEKAHRARFFERYGNPDGQMQWFYDVLTYLTKHIPETTPLVLYGRSTGSGLILQGFKEYHAGVSRAQIMERVSVGFADGLVGTQPEHIRMWYWKEFLGRVSAPHTKDEDVARLGPVFFGGLNFDKEGPKAAVHGKRKQRVIVPINGRDSFFPWQEKVKVANQFATNCPNIDVELRYNDTGHDSASPGYYDIEENGQITQIQISEFARLLPQLSYIVSNVSRSHWKENPASHFLAPNIVEVFEESWPNVALIKSSCKNELDREDLKSAFEAELATHGL
jgi:hypothetical protein